MKELSQRENEIIELLISGYDYGDIANLLKFPLEPYKLTLKEYSINYR